MGEDGPGLLDLARGKTVSTPNDTGHRNIRTQCPMTETAVKTGKVKAEEIS